MELSKFRTLKFGIEKDKAQTCTTNRVYQISAGHRRHGLVDGELQPPGAQLAQRVRTGEPQPTKTTGFIY